MASNRYNPLEILRHIVLIHNLHAKNKKNLLNINKLKKDKTFMKRQIVVSGLPATEYQITWLVDLPGIKKGDISINTIAESKGVIYSISLTNYDELETYRQVLSSFKFTN